MTKTTLLIVASGALCATVVARSVFAPPVSLQNKRSADQAVTIGSSHRLQVNVKLGQVELIADNSRELTVHSVRSFEGPNDDKARSWVNDSFITVENRNGVLSVKDHPFGKDSLDNLKWGDDAKSDKSGRTLKLEMQIHVPYDLAATMEVLAGKATVRGKFRSVDANVSAGQLSSDKVVCSGNSSFKVGAGEVKMVLPPNASLDVSANVGVGRITGLPSGEERKGDLHIGDKRHGRSGNGDSKVEIHVGAGSIKVEGGSSLRAMQIKPGSEDSDPIINVDIDGEVNDAVRQAMSAAAKALESVNTEFKFDWDKDKGPSQKEMAEMNKAIAKAMAQIRPEIEKAMKQVKPEIDAAIKQAREEIAKAMRELDRAAKDGGKE